MVKVTKHGKQSKQIEHILSFPTKKRKRTQHRTVNEKEVIRQQIIDLIKKNKQMLNMLPDAQIIDINNSKNLNIIELRYYLRYLLKIKHAYKKEYIKNKQKQRGK